MNSGAFFRQAVTSMNVRSSVSGIVSGDDLAGGNISLAQLLWPQQRRWYTWGQQQLV